MAMQGIKIDHQFSYVHHSQTNKQVEASNKVILTGFEKRVDTLKSNWVEELDNVLWVVRKTSKLTHLSGWSMAIKRSPR